MPNQGSSKNLPLLLDTHQHRKCNLDSASLFGARSGDGSVTVLTYSGTGPAITLNSNGSGIAGCTLVGEGVAGSVGLVVGGSNGNILGFASNLEIPNFDIGLQFGNNAISPVLRVSTSLIIGTSNVLFPSGIPATGENISFFGGDIANHTAGYSQTCINLQGTPQEIGFHNVSIDQCGVTLNSSAGLNFFNTHWENPGGATCDPFLTIGAGAASSQITIVGGTMYETFPCSTRQEFISVASGVHLSIFGGRYLPAETIAHLINSSSSSADFVVDGALLVNVTAAVGGSQRGSVWTNSFTAATALTVTGFGASIGGNLSVGGSLSVSGAKNFKIDHPLDPANKYLYHSSIESPDMLNLYSGNATLDSNGEAWVNLPQYFEALNEEFRYQLTALGSPAPGLFIARKVSANRFKIAGGKPAMEVSWQVTGIRHDPYANAHRVKVEEEKPRSEQGSYLHPELYQAPADGSLKATAETK